MIEDIEITVSWHKLVAHGITNELEAYLMLEIEQAVKHALDVRDVTVSLSGRNGLELWDADGDKVEATEDIKRAVLAIVADKLRETGRLAADVADTVEAIRAGDGERAPFYSAGAV
jgi:predicted secreted protein